MRQRKRRGWRANLAMVGLTVLLAGFSSPDEKANELFVRAVGEVEKGQWATAQSYVQAAERYKAALVKLEEIISDYAAASIAVRLASGEAKLAGVTYAEFKRTIVPTPIERADAETNPLDAAVLVAETIAVTDSKVRAMGDIAVAFAEAGRFDRVSFFTHMEPFRFHLNGTRVFSP